MSKLSLKSILLTLALLAVPVFIYLFWSFSSPETILSLTDSYQGAGTQVREDLATLAPQTITEEDQTYTITDTTSDGIDISFANEAEPTLAEGESEDKTPLTLSFPKDYSQPIEVKLDEERTITITDLGGKSDYQASTISATTPDSLGGEASKLGAEQKKGLFERILSLRSSTPKSETPQTYLRYTSKDQRKELLYAYQKDQATGEKKLKHWTLYQEGNGVEQESYQIENAKLKITEEGIAQVFYYGTEDLKNDQAAGEVDSNLLERAQRTLAKEMGDDLLNGNHTPDLTIPKPYYLDREGNRHDAEWKWHEETGTLSVSFTPESYPVALDPTLSFTAPGTSNSGSVITGEAASSSFGTSLTTGDFNSDGRTDLAVGASYYSTNTGRTYIFYNDGTFSPSAATADVIITGETTINYFGTSLTTGDFNSDGRTDLVVAAYGYSSNAGRAYIFYNDGSIPVTAATADVIITGEIASSFGYSLAVGDWNADGKTDLAVGAWEYSSETGRAYVFYNDGSIPTTAAAADAIISGETSDTALGVALATGDLNSDGKMDLAVGAHWYGAGDEGRVYIFYSGSIITENASGADVIISHTGSNQNLGYYLTTGDFNADGRTDLAATSNTGIHVFYNDGSIPATAATADLIITGATGFLMAGDMNMDGRTDLIAASSSIGGIVYVFYNDGSIPTTILTPDVKITGETFFGASLAVGDLNSDGKTDLIVGSRVYASSRGRTYIFYSQNGQVNTNQSIVGEATSNSFGRFFTTGDFNADGRIDLAVGSYGYSTNTGRAYVFYGDGQIPSTAATADAIISGETASDTFGRYLVSGDFNTDGKTDLAIDARGYSSSAGRAYIFYGGSIITENASGADVIITGEASSNFGYPLAAHDVNTDGRVDLVAGGAIYNSSQGRAYVFYNDGSIPTTAVTADLIIAGEAGSGFGSGLAFADLDVDGKADLIISGSIYSTNTGRVYAFYNDGSIPTTAASADVIITGEATDTFFGDLNIATGDFNTDSRTDFLVGASGYGIDTGRAYVFYNDGSLPSGAASADIIFTGEAGSNNLAAVLAAGDLNADGRVDIILGANGYSSTTGRAYVLYNDGSYPSSLASADVIITGETAGDSFGRGVGVGDLSNDGRTDLIVGAFGFTGAGATGKVYIYETRENFAWEIQEQFGGASRTGVNGTGQELQIVGETGSQFGWSLAAGDFNADGKTDLAVGANGYSSNTGRVYVFYGDGSLSVGASSADIILTGEATNNYFGYSLTAGDWNSDGKTDLAAGAYGYSTLTGRTYIFYNGSIVSENASSADVIITGEASSYFGLALTPGDWNSDGKTDLAVGASGYSTSTGRAYIFYNGSIITENASGADIILTGETTSNYFGVSLAPGDFNADGKTDLAVGARGYSTNAGRAYIFYSGSIITENASGADVIISGEASSGFGISLVSGDFNADGKTDLAVGAYLYSTNTGRAYIFYNDGSIPTTAATADVILTGETTSNYFGYSLAAGDFNADGKTDLAVGARGYSSNKGKVYIYTWNDPILTGETTNNNFGYSLTSGDFNADGKADLAVGAYGYSSSAGRAYIFYSGSIVSENASGADVIITGETSLNYFGYAMTSGDWNADGKTDLAVDAYNYSSAGRVYIFYSGSIITENASGADVIITGEAGSYFGYSLASGDFNADGKTDLAVGAYAYSSYAGRAYIFYSGSIITEAATGADVIITGEAGSYFGTRLASGDYNADGKTDLAVSAVVYSGNAGRTYLFYNGSIITEAATGADIIVTGEASSYFGWSLTSGDYNADGKTDLAVGANLYASSTGRAYIFYNGSIVSENASGADVILTSEAASSSFGSFLVSGDFNTDGKTDLAVSANGYSSSAGRVYIFYGGSIVSENASGADVKITGVASSIFGQVLASGDWNADGKTDLAVGANGYSTSTGRVYLYTSEVSAALTPPGGLSTKGGLKIKGGFKLK